MSGGVDSSVAAALLVRAGYDVTGGFMKNFSAESWTGVVGECPWEQDFADVQSVCKQLGIPCRSFNFEKQYTKSVIEYFFREYRAGRTPNPDVLCNRDIKFGAFLTVARRLGFSHIATGHYAKIRNRKSEVGDRIAPSPGSRRTTLSLEGEGLGVRGETAYQLLRGVDRNKDQSYFLYRLNQRQLSQTLFPIGDLPKPEVRVLARKWNLPTADKPDSQGICFIGHVDVRKFLQQRLAPCQGPIVDTEGQPLGEHPGVWYYTIGQRHGIGLSGGPWYVAAKDLKRNRLVVARGRRHPSLYANELRVNDVHWVQQAPALPQRALAQIRYRQRPQRCRIARSRDGLALHFDSPQFAPALGQSAVLYHGATVLGGGIIDRI